MARKKTESGTPAQPKQRAETPPQKDTVTVSIEVSKRTYESMATAAKACGFTFDEWLADIIRDSV